MASRMLTLVKLTVQSAERISPFNPLFQELTLADSAKLPTLLKNIVLTNTQNLPRTRMHPSSLRSGNLTPTFSTSSQFSWIEASTSVILPKFSSCKTWFKKRCTRYWWTNIAVVWMNFPFFFAHSSSSIKSDNLTDVGSFAKTCFFAFKACKT